MTSKKVEDVHLTILNELLSASGLECLRSPQRSSEGSISSVEPEVLGPKEEQAEVPPEAVPEELLPEIEEELPESIPDFFPTPSLRRMIPDRIRKIEEQNRIHVLPEEFLTDIDPQAIPKIAVTPPQKYIDILAELVGCKKYKSSLAEYWFLDTLANLLRRAQEDLLDRPTQTVLILWFCEWMKEMQQFDAADRQRMLRRFKDTMLSAAQYIAETDHLPTPAEAGVYYKARDEPLDSLNTTTTSVTHNEMKHLVTFEGAAYECSLQDMTKIIHYIFDLFSTDFQYNLVRSVFTFPPEYNLIDSPYQIENPKRLYAPLKIKPKKEKSPKKDAKNIKGKKKEVDTPEYLALLELIAKDEREQEEKEMLDREEWHRRRHILPLVKAARDELFDKYWPPPPPEPEPEPEPEPKTKGKKGKKFSTDFQYNLVRSVFTFPPEYNLIDSPYQIENPKRLYAPLKIKPKKEKSPKKDAKNIKGKKKEVDTPEYLALLELIAKDEREQEEKEMLDREEWHRRRHILPLVKAARDELFDKYWPPPPPEPEPEPEPEPKTKGKKGKK